MFQNLLQDTVSAAIPPQVTGIVDALLQAKIGNVKIDFSKVKFPTSPADWEALGKKIQAQLKEAGQNITIEDAINLARRMAQAAQQAGQGVQQGGQPAPKPTKTDTPFADPEKEVSTFIETASKDKRYWLGTALLWVLLLRK